MDETCANWSLRFITDVDVAEEVELKKDTHRQEEIRALKQAWEAAEPGRAVKVDFMETLEETPRNAAQHGAI